MDKLDVPIDAVVIPVGGAGLLAGMATIFKHLAPQVQVIVSNVLAVVMLCHYINIPMVRCNSLSRYKYFPMGRCDSLSLYKYSYGPL